MTRRIEGREIEHGCEEVTAPLTKDSIVRQLVDNKAALDRMGVQSLALFGSYARGVPQPASDLDFLVELNPKTFDNYMDLKFFLEDLFQKPVDLVLKSALKPQLRDSITRELVHVPRT